MNEEEVYFYFENREKINRLAEIRGNVISHIWKAIEEGNAKNLKPVFKENGLKLSIRTKNNVNYCYYTFDALPDKVMLTLVYDTLWNYKNNGCRIRMFLELQSKEMISFVENQSLYMKDFLGLEPDGHQKNATWWHYKGFEIPFTPKELTNENTIVTRIVDAIKQSHFYEDGLKIIALWKEYHK